MKTLEVVTSGVLPLKVRGKLLFDVVNQVGANHARQNGEAVHLNAL
jgi:hypothetical protein